MQTVGIFEAKTHFSTLLNKVEKGEQIMITRHGQVVAKLVPATKSSHLRVKQAITKLKSLRQTPILSLDWKKLRDEGRH